MSYKYGLKPVLEQPRVKLSDFYTSDLPSVDSLKFPLGHSDLVDDYGMLMNNKLGCCAEAAALHSEMVWAAEAKKPLTVTDDEVVALYSAVTGYDPDDPSTDAGTDVHELFSYWAKNSIIGSDGSPIVGYAGLTPGDPAELAVALSLFTTVFIGVQVPESAEQQFAAGEPWQITRGRQKILGGHAIPVVDAQSADLFDVVTWGKKNGMTSPWYQAFGIVAVVALTHDMFNGNTDIDGIDFGALSAALPNFTGTVSTKAPKRSDVEVAPRKSREWSDEI